ncbi:hypothetical protein [Streptomyces solaniscabiei]|uniref:hypothetical protein n=1 Tax=Streptomyces solaniscabiei TaxID=2683255 RepID=UPI001CE327A7|nr:hypothetical protein [Streptomyces solaniscabiei]
MADEPEASRPGEDAAQLHDDVQNAIDWFSTDRSHTRQAIEHPAGAISPGHLLGLARFGVQFTQMLNGSVTDQAQDLVQAQADWLIHRMPSDHTPLSLDSAQQAGRAWGILIATDTEVLPDHHVLNEVADRTGISRRAAAEIRTQAHRTHAAYNRADLLIPYDDASDDVLINDWNRLVACGPELPEAAERAKDVLELLTARITGADDHEWMEAAAQHAAQVYSSIIRAQPLLAPVATVMPRRNQLDASAEQARLVQLDQQGRLTAAATAAARARAVQEWAGPPNAADADRTRTVEAAAPATRTLLQLNSTLAAIAPVLKESVFTVPDPQRVAQVVEAIGKLSTRVSTTLRSTENTAMTGRPSTTQPQQHPPTPGGGNARRAAP